MPESDLSLADLAHCCQRERVSFSESGERSSPCCMNLLRKAFADDQDAWYYVVEIFQPLIRRWIQRVCIRFPDLIDEHDQTEVADDALLKLKKGVDRQSHLLQGDDLAKPLAYLKKCAERSMLSLSRRKRKERELPADNTQYPDHSNELSDPETRIALSQRLEKILSEEEAIVIEYIYRKGCKPQELLELFLKHFPDVGRIYQIKQNVIRRLRNDPVIRDISGHSDQSDHPDHRRSAIDEDEHRRQKPQGPESLKIELETALETRKERLMDTPCTLDEETLLNYVAGLLSAERRLVVEANPDCVRKAQVLAAEIAAIEASLYRLHCPDVDSLHAYYHRELEATQHLVIHRHVETCRFCQEELELLRIMDETPLIEPSPLTRIRQIVEAIWQPALAQQLRGQALIYAASEVLLTLNTRRTTQGIPRWTIFGELRMPDGSPPDQPIEQVLAMRDNGEPITATLEEDGTFILRDLAPGTYRITVYTPEKEIVIRSLKIGVD